MLQPERVLCPTLRPAQSGKKKKKQINILNSKYHCSLSLVGPGSIAQEAQETHWFTLD